MPDRRVGITPNRSELLESLLIIADTSFDPLQTVWSFSPHLIALGLRLPSFSARYGEN